MNARKLDCSLWPSFLLPVILGLPRPVIDPGSCIVIILYDAVYVSLVGFMLTFRGSFVGFSKLIKFFSCCDCSLVSKALLLAVRVLLAILRCSIDNRNHRWIGNAH